MFWFGGLRKKAGFGQLADPLSHFFKASHSGELESLLVFLVTVKGG